MTDKEFKKFSSIYSQICDAGLTDECGFALANAIILTIWEQKGAREDSIEVYVDVVTKTLRKSIREYLNRQQQ